MTKKSTLARIGIDSAFVPTHRSTLVVVWILIAVSALCCNRSEIDNTSIEHEPAVESDVAAGEPEFMPGDSAISFDRRGERPHILLRMPHENKVELVENRYKIVNLDESVYIECAVPMETRVLILDCPVQLQGDLQIIPENQYMFYRLDISLQRHIGHNSTAIDNDIFEYTDKYSLKSNSLYHGEVDMLRFAMILFQEGRFAGEVGYIDSSLLLPIEWTTGNELAAREAEQKDLDRVKISAEIESAGGAVFWSQGISNEEIEVVFFSGTDVTDADLARLQGLTDLQSLLLRGTQVTDAGLARLQALTGLQMLTLSGTQVTDAGLARLQALTGLQSLDLRDTGIVPAAVNEFQQALPKLKIQLDERPTSTPVDDRPDPIGPLDQNE